MKKWIYKIIVDIVLIVIGVIMWLVPVVELAGQILVGFGSISVIRNLLIQLVIFKKEPKTLIPTPIETPTKTAEEKKEILEDAQTVIDEKRLDFNEEKSNINNFHTETQPKQEEEIKLLLSLDDYS